MSVHQIIYTSCMRGINGMNDGQQVYSYDAQFRDIHNNEIKSLFSYYPPNLEAGKIMTEEIAATLPRAFTFRKLDSGSCALALSTYLGRDYMGSTGRFGNHLSHVVIAEPSDILNYPCEYYGCVLLRDHMKFEEVNNPNPPDFLPAPLLEKGFSINIESVMEFLETGDRLEIYKNMLYGMLAYERERKRVVICDEPENIILWIAALEYAVPIKNALKISFTTYEFDPSLSASRICGVVSDGTRYNNESKRFHFVFDLLQKECAVFDKENNFFDFIDTAFTLSYDSMQDFHNFLIEGYGYESADEELYAAYTLYSLLSDGIQEISENKIKEALEFAGKYGFAEEKIKIVENIMKQKNELIVTDKEVFLDIIKYILMQKDGIRKKDIAILKKIMIERILTEFINEASDENSFLSFYRALNRICKKNFCSLSVELMTDGNWSQLLTTVRNKCQIWKVAFIISVISNFVKENHFSADELTPEKLPGKFYYEIMITVYSEIENSNFNVVTCILDEFAFDCLFLTNMALNIEGILLDLPNGHKDIVELWNYYGQKMISHQLEHFDIALSIFYDYKRFDQIIMLFKLKLEATTDEKEIREVFNTYFSNYMEENRNYIFQYVENFLTIYYERLNKFEGKEILKAKFELVDLIADRKLTVGFADELISDLLNDIPLQSPGKREAGFIQSIFQYKYNFKGQRINGKLLLLCIGMVIERIDIQNRSTEKFDKLEILTKSEKADVSKLSDKGMEDYFDWILPISCKLCRTTDELTKFYQLFKMTENEKQVFFVKCTKLYLKICNDEKDYDIFYDYFGFMCKNINSQIKNEVAKLFCNLNRTKIEKLDQGIKEHFSYDYQLIDYWKEIKEMVDKTNPLLKNFSNLFKRKKK